MKQTMKLLAVVAAIGGLAACAAPQSPNQLSQKTVNYQCGPGGTAPLSVQYTFQGSEPLSARVIYQNQVVLLPRATASNVDMVGNTFRSEHYTWITQPFNYDTVDTAHGDMLTREIIDTHTTVPHATATVPSTANTVPPVATTVPPATTVPVTPSEEVSNIIVRDCVPVAAARS